MTIVSRQALNHGERPCFICGKSAKVCARNRTHTVKEMQKKNRTNSSRFLKRSIETCMIIFKK
ncbi:citrate lyase holo-[acyl-carrier protein] synthase [Enterococcus faecium]